MFAVSSSRTMANAKFRVTEPMKELAPVRKHEEPRVVMLRAEVAELQELARKRQAAIAEIHNAQKVLMKFSYGSQNQRIGKIVARICKALRVHPGEVMSSRRNRKVVMARQAIMYWSVRQTQLSLPSIGRRLGGRDHTTVLHGVRAYREKRQYQGRFLRLAR